jgi:hypothetical protein
MAQSHSAVKAPDTTPTHTSHAEPSPLLTLLVTPPPASMISPRRPEDSSSSAAW